jgi:hypothetical protein
MVVNGVKLVDGAYHPGFGQVSFEGTDQTLYVSDANAIGFEGCLRFAEQMGHDTKQFRIDLRTWVKTGRFPNAKQPA